MAEKHKYPRRFRHKTGFLGCDYAELRQPGELCLAYKSNGELVGPTGHSEEKADKWVKDGSYIETFDHHKPDCPVLQHFEERRSIVFLKSLVKQLREELAKEKAKQAEQLIGSDEAHKLLLKALSGNASVRREIRRKLFKEGAIRNE